MSWLPVRLAFFTAGALAVGLLTGCARDLRGTLLELRRTWFAGNPAPEEGTAWEGEICKRCLRRSCLGYEVPDETWGAVAGPYSILCLTCFDELAELAGVRYRIGNAWPVSWSMWKREVGRLREHA